ncbi:MAG: GH2 [uncultured Chloroflexi bacterium]|uniref:GH2 n=1 Tax=uncultured Chloroflexota bacterium TaxID=166587 RepID=A0A6J4K0Y4_9CHLR|nr:MAG: GH2 [uncultured Chloroflexota bacterium]
MQPSNSTPGALSGAAPSVPPPMPDQLTPDIPRPEHPRPDFRRDDWINLNGHWRFSFDPQNVGEQMRWYHVSHPVAASHLGEVTDPVEDPFGADIVVPFPWESRLSEINETGYKGAAWYQRAVEVPRDWAERPARATGGTGGNGAAEPPADIADPAGPGGLGVAMAAARAGADLVGAPTEPRPNGGEPSGNPGTPGRRAGRGVSWRLRPYLCFGAVDWSARVWINGRFVAEHDGGYTPFEVDISRFVRPGVPVTLTVRAWDATDADTPLGKQTEEWYTHSSGIWQTVWIEGRPAAHLTRAHVTPHLEAGRADFSFTIAAPPELTGRGCVPSIESADGLFPAVERRLTLEDRRTDTLIDLPVPNPRAWSPEDPHLYDCVVTLRLSHEGRELVDTVNTYFGLRTISSARWDNRPYDFVFLNGEPVYLRGILDQAFHPDSLHSYPSDDVIRGDIQAAKDLGLNFVRCHIKINDPRYYYWCDRLGMLCMYDFPSASIYTPKARANWERTFREALERDYSHPSIFSWILFNETWGLEEHQRPEGWGWVREMYYLCKRLDPTRLVEDNSPYLYDHVTTDINTWHFYISDYDQARRHVENVVSQTYEGSPYHFVGGVYADVEGAHEFKQGTQPLLNSEYAGISAWGGDRDISYTFKFLTTELRRHDIICGYVYTELADVEWEHNGLLNYDRTPKEFGFEAFVDGMTVADVNGADFVGLDAPPCQTIAPGGTFKESVFISHWDRRPLADPVLCWRATTVDRFGERRVLDEGERIVSPRRYAVTDVGDLELQLPDEQCLVTVALWLEDRGTSGAQRASTTPGAAGVSDDGRPEVRARNYVNVEVHEGEQASQRSWARLTQDSERIEYGYALRFLPGDFLGSSWGDPRIGPRGSKFGAAGAGWVEYAVTIPTGVTADDVKGLRLVFEAGARTARNRLDWRDPRHNSPQDYPQTETRKLPSDLVVRVNGVRVGSLRLPDDPADARGVLSAHNSPHWEPCSYGFLTQLSVDADTARRIIAEAKDERLLIRFEVPRTGVPGGLNLYGARMGAYPIDPVVILDV